MPLGQIDLPVTFGNPVNFRTETLTFEVVSFPGSYHAILGRPCYAKFMAVPNYTYLKLKMPGPKGIISVGMPLQVAHQCDLDSCQLATAIIANAERSDAPHDAAADEPNFNTSTSGTFKSAEDTKALPIIEKTLARPCGSRPHSARHRKARSLTSSTPIGTPSHGNLPTCRASRGKSPSTPSTSTQDPDR